MATYERITYGSPDGAIFGNGSSEPIGFYGTAPSAQIAISTAISTTASISTAGLYGFATSTEALQIARAVSTVCAALVTLGLFRSV